MKKKAAYSLFLAILLVSLMCSVFSGTFKTALGEDSTVSITNVMLQQSFVEQGFTLPVTVTIQNSGSVSEVANVQLFANSTSIFNGTLSLDSLASGTLTCPVDTDGLSIGKYTITASAISSSEPNLTPSTISGGTFGVTYLGDLNGDFKVNFNDLVIFAADYTAYFTNGIYTPAIDFYHDSQINFKDLQLFVSTYTAYWNSLAQQAPTSPPTSAPVTSYNYYMDISGSNYQILNSAQSDIYESTSSASAFNYMINLCTSGCVVEVKSGAYSVAASWWDAYLSDYNEISGVTVDFASGAILTAVTDLNAPVIYIYGCSNDTINGVTINANGANQVPGSGNIGSPQGIEVVDCSNTKIENAVIYNARVFGVSIADDASTTNTFTNDGVVNSTLYCTYGSGSVNDGWNGIQLGNNIEYLTDLYAINNVIYGWSDVGISNIGTNSIITGNYLHDLNGANQDTGNGGDAHWGIADESGGGGSGGSSGYALIAGNTITNCGATTGGPGAGIAIDSDYNIVSGNTLTNCNIGGCGASLYLTGTASYCIVEFNSINGHSDVGIALLDSSCVDNTVYGNTFSGCTTNISNSGTNTIYTAPSIVVVTVTSSPLGSSFIRVNNVSEPYLPYTFAGYGWKHRHFNR